LLLNIIRPAKYYLPYSGYTFPLDAQSSLDDGLRLFVSVGDGEFIHSIVDTGSEGILFSRRFLGPNHTDTGEPFALEYTSSKNTYQGTWVWASITFSSFRDAKTPGAVVARTVRMRIRAVDQRNEETDPEKITTAMIGVGFDRDTSPGEKDPGGHLIPRDINPFLQLEDMVSGILRPGFVLDWSARAIVLGLLRVDDASFERVPLIPQPYGWVAPLVTVALPASGIFLKDTILLVDSGVGNTIVQAPDGVTPPPAGAHLDPVEDGLQVCIQLTGLDRPLYSFTVGQPGTGAPAKLLWGHKLHDGMSFVNTGRHALSQFDYLFDAERGVLGFRFHASGCASEGNVCCIVGSHL
jgi:hypothetical protein